MSNIRLSQDADFILCVMYDTYLQRIKNGSPKSSAKYFGSSEMLQSELFQSWPTLDIDETARELSRCGLLSCLFADDELAESALTPDSVVYMENRFKDRTNALFDRIEQLRHILLG